MKQSHKRRQYPLKRLEKKETKINKLFELYYLNWQQ